MFVLIFKEVPKEEDTYGPNGLAHLIPVPEDIRLVWAIQVMALIYLLIAKY